MSSDKLNMFCLHYRNDYGSKVKKSLDHVVLQGQVK